MNPQLAAIRWMLEVRRGGNREQQYHAEWQAAERAERAERAADDAETPDAARLLASVEYEEDAQ